MCTVVWQTSSRPTMQTKQGGKKTVFDPKHIGDRSPAAMHENAPLRANHMENKLRLKKKSTQRAFAPRWGLEQGPLS